MSLFNETENENIAPTPAVGVVGLNTEKVGKDYSSIKSHFQNTDSDVYLLSCRDFVWSGYAGKNLEGQGELDLKSLSAFSKLLLKISRSKDNRPTSSRVVGRMGLAGALSNMCSESVGFDLEVEMSDERLFGEGLYEVILEFNESPEFEPPEEFSFVYLGKTTQDGLINLDDWSIEVANLKTAKKRAWEKKVGV